METPSSLAEVGTYLDAVSRDWEEGTTPPLWASYRPLQEALADVESLQGRLKSDELLARRDRLDHLIDSLETFFSRVTPQTMGTLLSFQPTPFSRRVGSLLLQGALDLLPVTEAELDEVNRRRLAHDPSVTETLGGFLMSGDTAGRPAVFLLQYEPKTPSPGERRDFFRQAANVTLHEAAHLFQALRHGLGWIDENLEVAEGEAIALEAAFRLVNGDGAFHDRIALFSPFGFESALANAVRHVYRHKGALR